MRGHVLAVLVFLLAPPSTEGAFFSPRAMLVPTLQRATSCFACAAEDAREVLKAKLEDAVVEREACAPGAASLRRGPSLRMFKRWVWTRSGPSARAGRRRSGLLRESRVGSRPAGLRSEVQL